MIVNRQTLTYHGEALIEKLTITPPYRLESIFPNGGCFIYVADSLSVINSSTKRLLLGNKQAVLLKCATCFVDFLKNSFTNAVMVYAVHLYEDVLKRIYRLEIPELIRQHMSSNILQEIIPDYTISRFIENLEIYFENTSLVNNDLLELKIKELILLLIQTKNAESVRQVLAELLSPRKFSILEVVNFHLYSNLSVAEMAKLCNMSLSSFKKEFKKLFNDSPQNYMTVLKLKRAKELLETSDLSINEVAYEIGYSDPSYFTRQFKKTKGVSPSTFRKTLISSQKS